MPRFGIKTLLLAVAFAAIWLSSYSGYKGDYEVRRSMLLIVFLATGCAAVCYHGARRAFWAGFFLTMLILRCEPVRQPLVEYAPKASELAEVLTLFFVPDASTVQDAVYETLTWAFVFALSAIVGFVFARIYGNSQKYKGSQL